MTYSNAFIGCGARKLHRRENARPETAESSVPHSAPRLWFSSALVSPPLCSLAAPTSPASLRATPPAGPSESGRPAGSAARTARCASWPWGPAPPYPPSSRARHPADEPLRNGPFLFPTWFPGPSDLLSFPFSFPPQVVGPPTADGNRFGAVTCAARIRDKMNRTTIMVQFTQLFQGLFAYSPRSSLSFSRSCRKTIADGRITP